MGPYSLINQQSFLFLLFYVIHIMVMTFTSFDQVSCYIHYIIQNYGQKPLKMTFRNISSKKSFKFL